MRSLTFFERKLTKSSIFRFNFFFFFFFSLSLSFSSFFLSLLSFFLSVVLFFFSPPFNLLSVSTSISSISKTKRKRKRKRKRRRRRRRRRNKSQRIIVHPPPFTDIPDKHGAPTYFHAATDRDSHEGYASSSAECEKE